ncbi:MAG: DNA-binding transcriptional regulator [Planctomycetia bacterium]|nr:DNA-binding transcriptional regulator [Planctomycetia bacterium]
MQKKLSIRPLESGNQKIRVLLLLGTSHGYGRLLIDGIAQHLYECGCEADFDFRGHLEAIPSWIQDWHGDGIIVRHHLPETFDLLNRMAIPYVKLNCPEMPSDVDVDEDGVGETAISYFQERGFEHFAYFAQCNQYWTRRRRNGIVEAVRRIGRQCSVFVKESAMTMPVCVWPQREQDELVDWLQSLPKPVGLVTAYDMHAKQILELCQAHGIMVPDQIAVLGINNEKWFCRMQTPPLSSIIQNGKRTGYEASRLLLKMIRGEPLPKLPILFPPIGVETRKSTDLIATQDEDVAAAIKLIRNGSDIGLTVEEVVDSVGLSRRTLERKFKKQCGRTLGEEIIRHRIELAKDLLRTSDMPVGNISIRLGFCSHSYFVHLFRDRTGITPTDYRNSFKMN